MTNLQNRDLESYDVISEVADMFFEEEQFRGIVANLTVDGKECESFLTPFFVLVDKADGSYELSFTVEDYRIEKVARWTHALSLYLGEDLVICEDNFLDKKTGDMFFGEDAYKKYEDFLHAKKGLVYCGVCERYVPEEIYLKEKEYCKICREITLPQAVFH